MRLVEPAAIAATFVEDADQVYGRICASQGARQCGGIMHIAIVDAYPWQHAQLALAVAIAREHADAVAVRMQSRNQMATDEPGSAKDNDAKRFHESFSVR